MTREQAITDIVERLHATTVDQDNHHRMDSEGVRLSVEQVKEIMAEIERLKIESNERVSKLLAQIVALTAEIERLRALGPDDDWEERGAAGELRAEIERLRLTPQQVYLQIIEGWLRNNRGIHFTDGAVDDLCKRIARALEHKP